ELRAILFKCSVAHLDPLPFPTRRSSDLYLIPWTALLGVDKGSVLSAANGTWFIWVVGSQAVAVLAATLQPMFVDWRQALAMLAVVSWAIGVFLYGVVGVVIIVRLLLYGMRPLEFTPPYW